MSNFTSCILEITNVNVSVGLTLIFLIIGIISCLFGCLYFGKKTENGCVLFTFIFSIGSMISIIWIIRWILQEISESKQIYCEKYWNFIMWNLVILMYVSFGCIISLGCYHGFSCVIKYKMRSNGLLEPLNR
jgi:hypothetical protein